MSPRRDNGMLPSPDVDPTFRERGVQEILRDPSALASIRDGGIPRAKVASAPIKWKDAHLINSWTALAGSGSTYPTPGYAMDEFNTLHLRGIIEGGATGTAAFTLGSEVVIPFGFYHMICALATDTGGLYLSWVRLQKATRGVEFHWTGVTMSFIVLDGTVINLNR